MTFLQQLLAANQGRLADLGWYKGVIDGLDGPMTQNAFIRFKEAQGFRARPFPGPLTLQVLWGGPRPHPRRSLLAMSRLG